MQSALTVKNYLLFYAMAAGTYEEGLADDLKELLLGAGTADIMDIPVDNLAEIDRVLVRSLITYMKGADCLLGVDILNDLQVEGRERLLAFLKSNFVDKGCLCVLLEKEHTAGDDRVDEIIRI